MDEGLKEFLKLIDRSKRVEDGWIRVSNMLWPTAKEWGEKYSELVELRDDQHIRMTDAGKIVLTYA